MKGLPCLIALACSAVPVSAVAADFANVSQGAIVDAGIGTQIVGDDLLGEIGGETTGVRVYRARSLVLEWDALASVRGGVLANEHPYFSLLGGHALGSGELGMRLMPERAWSPYGAVRLDGNFQALVPPGVSLAGLKGLNDMDGVGGIVATGDVRVAAGVSFLDQSRLLILSLFGQEALQAPETTAPGEAFTEGGISARFDLARQLSANIEGVWGRSIATTNSALGITDQKAHAGGSASLRYIFGNGMWLSGAASWSQESDHVTAAAITNMTASAPTFAVAVLYGFPLGRQE